MPDSVRPLVVVVDDDAQVRQELARLLQGEGYGVVTAEDGRQALTRVRSHHPDIVLLDVIMPGLDGLEVCRILKSRRDAGFLPVIILTSRDDMDSRVEGLRLGADDYLSKPADPRELLARIDALLRIKKLQDRISDSLQEMEDHALTDNLTGLYNARYLETRLRDEFKRAERYSEPLSCIVISMDGIDTLRDRHGGEAADRAVRELADILRSGIREFDVVVRAAEQRFIILLPRTHFTGSLAVATRIWERVHGHDFTLTNGKLMVSMGVSFFPNKDVASAERLIAQAQEALDKARQAGSDQICLFQHTTYFYRPDMSR